MNFAAVFHVSDYSFVQVQSDGSITIKLKVGSDDNIDKINLIHGNPFFGVKDEDGNWNWIKEATKMNFMGKGEFHSYYIINIKPKDKRIRYFFEIINKDEIIYYGEKDFHLIQISLRIISLVFLILIFIKVIATIHLSG